MGATIYVDQIIKFYNWNLSNGGQQNFGDVKKGRLQSYSEAYSVLGDVINNIQIIHDMPKTVASLLPNNYTAANLGCGDCRDTQKIQNQCKIMGKQGKFINVDPYISKEGVVLETAEEYLEKCQDNQLDLIFCKYSIHFVENFPSFFKNANRVLKSTGKMFIHQMSKDARLPWSPKIAAVCQKSSVDAADIIPSDLFSYELKEQIKQTDLDRDMFKQAVATRTWAHLLLFSQEQIDQEVKIIASNEHSMKAKLHKRQFILSKRQVSPL